MVNDTDIQKYSSSAIIGSPFGDDVIFLQDLKDLRHSTAVRIGYNAILFCRSGRIQVEVSNSRQVACHAGQLLLLPANKLVFPVMTSDDADAVVMLLSDKMLKSVLTSQITIWNRAMYLDEIYVINGEPWTAGLEGFTKAILRDSDMYLYKEVVRAFLRIMLLMICEQLLLKTNQAGTGSHSTEHEKAIFDRFLSLLAAEECKRHRVAYYAGLLNITPKHLSTICRKVSDKPPIRWITESVMEDCYTLLTDSPLSVKEISNKLGFPNPSFFGQYFREQAGMTPLEYRIRHKTV